LLVITTEGVWRCQRYIAVVVFSD